MEIVDGADGAEEAGFVVGVSDEKGDFDEFLCYGLGWVV